ncbi:MAG TPA: LacI family DNA-binding transcriptional regulator [Terracidiphilus sp.]|nr:LacI family DNA-binding transcriptional regulator [Terracidiphilus sp.]
MAVRLKDIADELGVSIVTVSKALRDRPDIAKATKLKILEHVKRMNYRPNLTARSLVTGRSYLVGLVVPDLIHPFFSEIAKALSSTLRKKEYFLIVSSSESDPTLEEEEIEHMFAHRLDCYVVASCQHDPEPFRKFGEAGVPLILLDRSFPGYACNFVGVNDRRVGQLATEHLIEQGCQRIAHIRGPETNVGNRRAEGFIETMQRHGLAVPEGYVIAGGEAGGSLGEERGKRAMDAVLALKPRPDALFCFNDTVAVGAMVRAFEAGLRIPQDIAIIGCGNYHYSSKLRVPLSSVDQRAAEIGERTAKMIISQLEKPATTRPRTVVLDPKLVVRASSQLR